MSRTGRGLDERIDEKETNSKIRNESLSLIIETFFHTGDFTIFLPYGEAEGFSKRRPRDSIDGEEILSGSSPVMGYKEI